MEMDGYLLVDKPRGLTSHDVVAHVRRILRQASSAQSTVNSQQGLTTNDYPLLTPSAKPKVGHTGTLDPLASGLLVLVIGNYTKKAGEFSKLDKTYEVELTLGYSSKTGDAEGPISKVSDKRPTDAEIKRVLGQFIGKITQTPHAHSAVKVGGQRAYKLARAGQEFKIEPRKVTVYNLQSTVYRYPKLCFTARVSRGTYIRSLAEDIGQKLGSGAYLSALRRIKVGNYKLENATSIDKISIDDIIKK